MTWLTWQQAGDRFGLSADAVRMRARRLGWRTQPGNEGRTLVEIPDDAEVKPRDRSPERATEGSIEGSAEQAASIARLTELLVAADARAERADLRAEKAEQRVEQAEQRADAVDTDRRAERARADALRDRLDAQSDDLSFVKAALDRTQAEAKAARERAEALQRDVDARKARGLLARLRAAVRGE